MKNLLELIPPAQALQIEITEWDGRRIKLSAPLTSNQNDKGTGFAGSIDALLDLAGWSAISLALRDVGLSADVMIVMSETQYSAAVRGNMTASAEIPASEIERILDELKTRGRSRLEISSGLSTRDGACASMKAHYAVIRTQGRDPG